MRAVASSRAGRDSGSASLILRSRNAATDSAVAGADLAPFSP